MKKTTKKTILRFVYIAATVVVIVLIGAFNTNFEDLEAAAGKIQIFWILCAIGSMAAYWLTDAWLLQYITNTISGNENRLGFLGALKIGIIGLYYGALTPSSIGTQPMQIIYMGRKNISAGKSTSIVVIKLITYSLTVIAFYLISYAIVGTGSLNASPAFYWLSIVGLLLNILAVAFFVLSISKEKMISKIGHSVIGLLTKARIMKHPEKPLELFDKTIADYTGASRILQGKTLKMVVAFLISFINIGFLFMITFFIYRAFGLNDKTFIGVMAVQALLYVAIHYFPSPGGVGASEGGFFAIFSAFFPQNLIFMAMLIWRIMTYYILLAVGSLVIMFDEFIGIVKSRRLEKKETG